LVQKFRRRLWNPKINYHADSSKPPLPLSSHRGQAKMCMCLVCTCGDPARRFRRTVSKNCF